MSKVKVTMLNSKKKVSARTQAKVRQIIVNDNFFVVRTLLGDAVGCVVSVGTFSIVMRLFVFGRFRLFRIPFSIIFDAFPFPCGIVFASKR
jgi:hypothetical protein